MPTINVGRPIFIYRVNSAFPRMLLPPQRKGKPGWSPPPYEGCPPVPAITARMNTLTPMNQ
jgi:hypothetical protein